MSSDNGLYTFVYKDKQYDLGLNENEYIEFSAQDAFLEKHTPDTSKSKDCTCFRYLRFCYYHFVDVSPGELTFTVPK